MRTSISCLVVLLGALGIVCKAAPGRPERPAGNPNHGVQELVDLKDQGCLTHRRIKLTTRFDPSVQDEETYRRTETTRFCPDRVVFQDQLVWLDPDSGEPSIMSHRGFTVHIRGKYPKAIRHLKPEIKAAWAAIERARGRSRT